jgi:hypothetical protein
MPARRIPKKSQCCEHEMPSRIQYRECAARRDLWVVGQFEVVLKGHEFTRAEMAAK